VPTKYLSKINNLKSSLKRKVISALDRAAKAQAADPLPVHQREDPLHHRFWNARYKQAIARMKASGTEKAMHSNY